MIGWLQGNIHSIDTESLILEVQGVGYEITLSGLNLADLSFQDKKTIQLWIYTHVREDQLQLFGFVSPQEKAFFLSLLKVNGVGPKLAMNILSGAPLGQVTASIEAGDSKALSKIPKVGKKIAEQIILTLQGKLVRVDEVQKNLSKNLKDIVSALENLGFHPQNVEEFVRGLPNDVSMEDGVRMGLSSLSGMSRSMER
ncbi:MAG: Holliday junction branch migration protein RuvA [Bdellovibrionota bacterium]